MLPDPISITLLVTKTLERLGVPYFIGGSIASTFFGMPRTTQDSDILAQMEQKDIPAFVQALQNEFYVDKEMIRGAIVSHSSFNILHKESMFKVDVFVPVLSNFINQQFLRASVEVVSSEPDMKAYLATPEDMILAKLDWYRQGGEVSERQWRDVLGIIKVQSGNLDINYLEKMATELGIDDLLNKVIAPD